jgi:FkbM family methyltransferase
MSLRNKINGLVSSLKFDNSLQLIADRTFFRRSRFVPYRLNGVDLLADQMGGDECGLRPCLVEGMYDPFLEAAGAFRKMKPLNIVDLGANAGGFSLIFATRGVAVKKIAAVEMNPLTYSRMRLNLLTAYGPKACPINAAIADKSGTISVPFSFGGTGDAVSSTEESHVFRVPALTFDEFLEVNFPGENIDIVKMDIEGSEWGVIDSQARTRLRDCSALIVEIHERPARSVAEFVAAMAGQGLYLSDVRNPREKDVYCFLRK